MSQGLGSTGLNEVPLQAGQRDTCDPVAQGGAQEVLEVLERGDFSREGLAVGKESSQDRVLATDGQNSCSPPQD